MRMSIRIIVYYSLINCIIIESTRYDTDTWNKDPERDKCLTGYMTDLQTWVDATGHIINAAENTFIDISHKDDFFNNLQMELSRPRALDKEIKFWSAAKCDLSEIPPVFHNRDIHGRELRNTVEYMSFYGNNLTITAPNEDKYDTFINASELTLLIANEQYLMGKLASWSIGFLDTTFNNLKELDLRACSISVLGDAIFGNMPQLTNLYLSENNIYHIKANAFFSLINLKHLDLSRNYHIGKNNIVGRLVFENLNTLSHLQLQSLDISFTKIDERNIQTITRIGKSLQRLSMCYTDINKLNDYQFNGTSLRYLDISGLAFSTLNILKGTEDTLKILYAAETQLDSLKPFQNFSKLEVLKLSHNNIVESFNDDIVGLQNLQILDLDNNSLNNWFNKSLISSLPKLKVLTLRNNEIHMLTKVMLEDIRNLSYVTISGNKFICNCYCREFYDIALKNELRRKDTNITEINNGFKLFHNGYSNYNQQITQRNNVTKFCNNTKECINNNNWYEGNFLILDYEEKYYQCYTDLKLIKFSEVLTCDQSQYLDMNIIDKKIWNKFYLMILLPVIILPMLFFVYTFRKNFKYFIITIRNSAMLSFINRNTINNENSSYNYDAFVSYCNDDRVWVLDHLLPHVEIDCNISVCLHERDFQVGLSILENIVSCMDKSRLIMLVISQQFLLSQWCQFEMHLAQHRLLETRREDLILILLEDIPKSLRPNTLHYLMMTKTYIVWPSTKAEQTFFWERMKKRLTTSRS